MNIFPFFHHPVLYFLRCIMFMPIGKLHFQIENCNVFVFVTTMLLWYLIEAPPVSNCNVFCHRVTF